MKAAPRPLIKWKSFWLGILVLVFLGWAWVRSIQHDERVYFGLGTQWWEIVRSHGTTVAMCWSESGTGRGIHSVSFSSEQSVEGVNLDIRIPPAFKRVVGRELIPAVWGVADWFLILLFLVPWASFLAWRVRKLRRLTQADA
jgi:hypothetical protein